METRGRYHRQTGGMTLLELLIALALMALLAAMALPGFGDLLARRQAGLAMDRVSRAVEFARMAAVTSGHLVTLCRSADGRHCGGNWEDGILIFADIDNDRTLAKGQQPLRYVPMDSLPGRLAWRAFQNRQYLQFTPLGFTHYQNGNFTYCPDSGEPEYAAQLIINRTGRVRRATDKDGDGIAEDSRGRPLRC